MRRLASFLTGRRTKWVALALWIALVAGLGPSGGRFEDAQQNDPASFLPESSEALVVLRAQQQFPSGQATPAVVVYRNGAGLSDADRETIDAVRSEIAADLPAGAREPTPVTASDDGKVAFYTVPIVAGGDETVLTGAVGSIRDTVGSEAGAGDGLVVKVTGPAGFSTDASEVFEGINSTLLYATVGIVFILLVLIYRSPIFWALPLLAIILAEGIVRGLGYLLAQGGVVINGQTAGITLVLVFGAGTDYALLLTARYREELRRRSDRHEAVRIAVERAGPTLIASAGTVIAGLLVLTLADVNGTAGLGPFAALGVAVAMLAALTALPALLLLGGRRAFWPFVPVVGEEAGRRTVWRRVGEGVAAHPRRMWIGTAAALAACCIGLLTLNTNLTSGNGFRGTVESVEGQELLAGSLPAGAAAPAVVLVGDPARVDAVRSALEGSPLVASVGAGESGPPGVRLDVTLEADPFGKDGYESIEPLRALVSDAGGPGTLVGGATAEERDLRAASSRDTKLLIPLVLVVVLAILVALLRALVAPLVLMATVILSFFATLGLAAVLFEYAFGFPGEDPSLALYAFVFLVALGIDYNIFLVARIREEAERHGTPVGVLTGLESTGAVITSAGIVLAGTFSVLAVLPLTALTQIGVIVAMGVLIDTIVVRSLLVPALFLEIGDRVWAPSALARRSQAAHAPPPSR